MKRKPKIMKADQSNRAMPEDALTQAFNTIATETYNLELSAADVREIWSKGRSTVASERAKRRQEMKEEEDKARATIARAIEAAQSSMENVLLGERLEFDLVDTETGEILLPAKKQFTKATILSLFLRTDQDIKAVSQKEAEHRQCYPSQTK